MGSSNPDKSRRLSREDIEAMRPGAALDGVETATFTHSVEKMHALCDMALSAPSAIGAPADHPLTVAIIGSELRISIGIDTLAFALQRIESWPDDFAVIDPEQFAKDVLRELEREREDGSTPVHLLLDKVGIAALDAGSIGCGEKLSASTDGGTDK